ncbi:hypothetical protein [Nonomuraea typhae]|uniref:Uncharacterized protein n=1 Tax=Nonomuraea typhae TaxID=2603600 RepID=A0ABW7Z9Y4_9ACTN
MDGTRGARLALLSAVLAISLTGFPGNPPGEDVFAKAAGTSHDWWPRYKQIAGQLRARFPREFTGSERAEDGSGVWFGFRGVVPREAVAMAKTLPVRVTFTGDLGYTEEELAAARDIVHKAVLAQPDTVNAASTYDVKTGTVRTWVETTIPPSATAERAAKVARINAISTPGPPGIRIEAALVGRIEINPQGGTSAAISR